MPFESISEEQREAFISSLKAGQYNLLLGAGASMDSSNAKRAASIAETKLHGKRILLP